MTTEQRKEETRKKFEKFCNDNNSLLFVDKRSKVFNFFYSEIEAREKKHEEEWMLQLRAKEDAIKLYQKINDKLQRLEEIIKAADGFVRQYELCDLSQVELCIEHYNKLKSKLPSGI